MRNLKKILTPLIAPLAAIILSFIVGALFILVVGKDPVEVYLKLFSDTLGNSYGIGQVLYKTTPLIFTGLSVAFAFKAGLFNIGAEGQYIVGLTVAQFSAFFLPRIPGFHWAAAVVLGMLAASAWGGIVGYLKARYAVSEVVATIMMNYVALYASRYATQFIPGTNTYKTPNFPSTARLSNPWLEGMTNNSRLNNGLFLALASVMLFWFIMEKTKTGFALRATGYNKDAARCSGIDVQRSLTFSMAISGAFAGLAGCIVALGSFGYGRVLAGLDGYGFSGIAVALVGNSTAPGTFLAGLLFGMLQSAQPLMQSRQIPKEVTNIISGLVVVFISLRSGLGLILEARAKEQARAAARKGELRDE